MSPRVWFSDDVEEMKDMDRMDGMDGMDGIGTFYHRARTRSSMKP